LAKWVRSGGLLIAAPDIGLYDSLGRKRPRSVLWKALGLEAAPARETAAGRGKGMALEPRVFAQEAVNQARSDSFLLVPSAGVKVVPYRTPHSLLVPSVRYESAVQPVVVRLPDSFRPTEMAARLFTPGTAGPRTLSLSSSADGATLTLTNLPIYSMLRISVR
jgi:hypothetical protein